MNPDLLSWGLGGAALAWILWSRFAGKSSPAEARQLVAAGAALIDVRSPGEFASGHIEGALNIPVHELGRRLAELGGKDRPVVVYCASGARSASAARMLKANGWARVADLGPMSRW